MGRIHNLLSYIDKKYAHYLAIKAEKLKIADPKRQKIASQFTLTEEQKNKIDTFYLENYGKKIPYDWHKYYSSYTGNFDEKYFPELLFIPEFERLMNSNNSYVEVFQDKNILPMLAKSAGVRMPETIFSCINGLIQDSHHNIVSINDVYKIEGEYFIKPTVDSCSGAGCQVINIHHGKDTITNEFIDKIIKSKGNNWVIQERIKCHDSIKKIYSQSVNTFRIMTYIWDNKIYYIPAIMRIGQGGSRIDNAHTGGMFIAIDADGSLHDTAFTEFQERFKEHPDTHFKYCGYKIPMFSKVLESAIHCHSFIPQVGCINWDFTIDESGEPLLIEANIRGGGIWVFEMAHGTGPFGEKTPEILHWIKFMMNAKKSDRNNHAHSHIIKK